MGNHLFDSYDALKVRVKLVFSVFSTSVCGCFTGLPSTVTPCGTSDPGEVVASLISLGVLSALALPMRCVSEMTEESPEVLTLPLLVLRLLTCRLEMLS